MTDHMLHDQIEKAVHFSKVLGRCYLLSNGCELTTAVSRPAAAELEAAGYWIAAIFENGFRVDA